MDKDGPHDGRKRMKIIKTAKRGKSHQKNIKKTQTSKEKCFVFLLNFNVLVFFVESDFGFDDRLESGIRDSGSRRE